MKITKNLLRRLIKESLEQMNEMAPPYAEYISGFSKATGDDFEPGDFSDTIEREIKKGQYVKGKGTILPFKDEISMTAVEKANYAKKLFAFRNNFTNAAPEQQTQMLLHPEEQSLSQEEQDRIAAIRKDYLYKDPMQPSIMSIVGDVDMRLKAPGGELPDTFVNVGQKKKGEAERHDAIKADRFLVGDMQQQLGDMYRPREKYKGDDTRAVSDDLNLQKDKRSGLSGGRPMIRGIRSGEYGTPAQSGLADAESNFRRTQRGEASGGFPGTVEDRNYLLRQIVKAYNDGDQQKVELLMTAAIAKDVDIADVINAATEGILPSGMAAEKGPDRRVFPTRDTLARKNRNKRKTNLSGGTPGESPSRTVKRRTNLETDDSLEAQKKDTRASKRKKR